jgi:aspartate-semialdehyde dehydrogenase
VVVGAGSLRGRELRRLLDRRTATDERVVLYDEDLAVGTLTAFGGEPTVITAVDPDGFVGGSVVFFAGSTALARRYAAGAQEAGAFVVDLSEGPGLAEAPPWIVGLDDVRQRPGKGGAVVRSPSSLAIAASGLVAACATFGLRLLVITALMPVSEFGQAGLEELEAQTRHLFNFQSVPQEVFGTQVAFNLNRVLPSGQPFSLVDLQQAVERDLRVYWGDQVPVRVQLLQAPVFHSAAFLAYCELERSVEAEKLAQALTTRGFLLRPAEEISPVQVSAREVDRPVVAPPEAVRGEPRAWWFWGVADNVLLVVRNAVAIAEKVLAG